MMNGKGDSAEQNMADVLQDKIKALPLEDIVWVVRVVDGLEVNEEESTQEENYEVEKKKKKLETKEGEKDEDTEMQNSDIAEGATSVVRMLSITDTRGAVINLSTEKPGKTPLNSQVRSALQDGMFMPFSGKPRRPKFVMSNDFDPSELHLSQLGITVISGSYPEPSGEEMDTVTMRSCTFCARRGQPQLFTPCPDCLALYYCSQKCQDDNREDLENMFGHNYWCAKMKSYMMNTEPLADFPFTYTKETTAFDFDRINVKAFLERYGVYNKGLWRRDSPFILQDRQPSLGEIPDEQNTIVLPRETEVLMAAPVNPPKPITEPLRTWTDYYSWRGFQLDSPIAILMTGPLTIYYIITTLLKQDHPETFKKVQESKRVCIDLVGTEKEADLVPVFMELGALLPQYHVTLVLTGPEVSKKISGKVTEKDNMKVVTRKGLYHNSSSQEDRPDVVIGLNAGLGAYMTWGETLSLLTEKRIPAYFTDYCRYSCECAKAPMEGMGLGTTSDPIINPFRSPVRRYVEEHNMPWYSNAFILTLKYGAKESA